MPVRRSLCLPLALLVAASLHAGVRNAVRNPGFEAGVLTPWYQDIDLGGVEDWNVTQSDAHEGGFSATVRGNKRIRQDFPSVPVSEILEFSLWLRQPEIGFGIVFAFYADGTTDSMRLEPDSDEWEFFDLTAFLDPDAKLNGIGVFGYLEGGLKDRTFLDEVLVLALRTGCPEDLDHSGAVDFGDIIILLTAWGGPGGPNDLDGSGTVDIGDLVTVLSAWGPCPKGP